MGGAITTSGDATHEGPSHRSIRMMSQTGTIITASGSRDTRIRLDQLDRRVRRHSFKHPTELVPVVAVPVAPKRIHRPLMLDNMEELRLSDGVLRGPTALLSCTKAWRIAESWSDSRV
jgi:hypothetical protein